jgi:hypothetical protein
MMHEMKENGAQMGQSELPARSRVSLFPLLVSLRLMHDYEHVYYQIDTNGKTVSIYFLFSYS